MLRRPLLPLLIAFFTAAGAIGLRAAPTPPPAVECRWTEIAPQIDGRATDGVWQTAATATTDGARTRLLWDRESLYFSAEVDAHDLSPSGTDLFALFLRPSEAHKGYYVVALNPAGTVRTVFFPEPGTPQERTSFRRGEFQVEAKVNVRTAATKTRSAAWSVEGRIPWSDLSATGGRPAPGESWSLRPARADGDTAAKFISVRFAGPATLPRERWENTHLIGSPEGPQGYRTARTWPKLVARSLVGLCPTPNGDSIWFVEQEGGREGRMRLRRLSTRGDGGDAETFFELDDMVYSIAFHPRFAENGFVYLGSNGPRAAPPKSSMVVRYVVRDGKPDPATRTVVIGWPSNGHNGAALAFANDGLLFVTSGDGTSHSDIDNVGQDPLTLRAKILRIDVDHPAAGKLYSVPPDNPFVDDKRFAPETWAYGLRNPWRLTYDPTSGQLWSGENGQDAWEYARLVQRGANYGWGVYEGAHLFAKNRKLGPHPVTFPTLEFSHAEFRSLTGGIVYRGKIFPELVGAYIFGDFGTGRVWAAKHDGKQLEWTRELVDTPFSLTHITADPDGELLLVDYGIENQFGPVGGGAIHRLEREPPPTGPLPEFPRRLSGAGLFSDVAKLTPLPGVLPYDVNVPGWHDGATAVHHLALPGNEALQYRPSKSWQLPDGAVLAQTLSFGGKRIETRVIVKQQNDFAGYTYVWNAAQTDAELADKAGADIKLADERPWRIPSRAECMMCHSREANFSLSLHESQLNHGDQLARWERLGLVRTEPPPPRGRRGGEGGGRFARAPDQPEQRTAVASSLLPRSPNRLRKFSAANDPQATPEERARSYLAVNCAHCHTLNGGGNSAMNFDWLMPLERMRAIDEPPQHGDFGLPNARVIAPGAAGRSVVIPRIAIRGPGQMPPVGTRAGDPDGVRVLAEWIATLGK